MKTEIEETHPMTGKKGEEKHRYLCGEMCDADVGYMCCCKASKDANID